MRGVHVDQDQAALVLREDVDAVQLGEGVAERRACPRVGRAEMRGDVLAWRGRLSDVWAARAKAR